MSLAVEALKLVATPYRVLATWRATDRISFRVHRPKITLAGATLAAASLLDFSGVWLPLGLGWHALGFGIGVTVAASPWLVERFESKSEPEGGRRRRRRSIGLAQTGPRQRFEIENISETGALLRAKPSALRLGQRIDLELTLSGVDESGGAGARPPVWLKAQVVRKQRPTWEVVGGVGVRFVDMGDPARSAIQAFIDEDAGEASSPSDGAPQGTIR